MLTISMFLNEPNQCWGPVSSTLVFVEIQYTRKMTDEFKGANFQKNLKNLDFPPMKQIFERAEMVELRGNRGVEKTTVGSNW